MKKWFTEHPRSVGETYLQHLFFAMIFGLQLIWAGLACLLHAFFPFLFQNTASNLIFNMMKRMINRLPSSEERVQALANSLKEKCL